MSVSTGDGLEVAGVEPLLVSGQTMAHPGELLAEDFDVGRPVLAGAEGSGVRAAADGLRRALERNAKATIARFAWHNWERLGLLSVRDDDLVLHSMKWPDEVRSPDELTPDASELMDSITTDDISGYRDHCREALGELIAAKAEGKQAPQPAEAEAQQPGQVVDPDGSPECVRAEGQRVPR
ncbi:Ku protein [Streptomyces sp. NPDC002206]